MPVFLFCDWACVAMSLFLFQQMVYRGECKMYKLKKVKIPDTVTYIYSNAFSGCKNIIIYAQKGSYVLKFAKNTKYGMKLLKIKMAIEITVMLKYQIII